MLHIVKDYPINIFGIDKDKKIRPYTSIVDYYTEIPFTTVEKAIAYREYVIGTPYEKYGCYKLPPYVKEETKWLKSYYRSLSRVEQLDEILKTFKGYENGYKESKEYKELQKIEKVYNELSDKIIVCNVESLHKMSLLLRDFKSCNSGGNEAYYYLRLDPDGDYNMIFTEEMREVTREFQKKKAVWDKDLEKLRTLYEKTMDSFDTNSTMLNTTRRYMYNSLKKTDYNLEKYNEYHDKNLFYAGANIYRVEDMFSLNPSDIIYDENRKLYNIAVLYKSKMSRLEKIIVANDNIIVLTKDGRVANTNSVILVDETIENGLRPYTELKSLVNPNNEVNDTL